jgi:hypothetical protein
MLIHGLGAFRVEFVAPKSFEDQTAETLPERLV